MKSIFGRFGIPFRLVSDNGPQYSAAMFEAFARSWGFEHVTSSPVYPQSNGMAEKTVEIVKRLIQKSRDLHLALLEYRNTPVIGPFTPAQLLMGRHIRSLIPITDKLLQPSRNIQNEVKPLQIHKRNVKPVIITVLPSHWVS